MRGDTAVIDKPEDEDKSKTTNKPRKATDNPVSEGSGANLVYILYLLAAVFPPAGLAGIAGVTMAYLNQPEASELAQSHYRFQIRSFWMWLGLAVIGAAGAYFLVGFLLLAAASIWLIIRCVKGMMFLNKGKPYPNPDTFLW